VCVCVCVCVNCCCCVKDGVKAEDIALANGRNDVADLLQKLTAVRLLRQVFHRLQLSEPKVVISFSIQCQLKTTLLGSSSRTSQ